MSSFKFQCEICDKQFTTKSNLTRHNIRHSEPTHKCLVCDKRFFSCKPELMAHQVQHTKDSKFICSSCGHAFGSSFNLKRHEKNVHLKEKTYGCQTCGKQYRKKEALSSHVSVKHDNKVPYQCEVCGKRYRYKFCLQRHVCAPQQPKQIKCSICAKEFSKSKYLHQHELNHLPPKHQCEICGRQFTWKAPLKKHFHSCNK